MNKKIKRPAADILLICAALALALIIYLSGAKKEAGVNVEVRLGGKIYAVLSLDEDAELDIDGKCTLKIEGGAAKIVKSDCPNGLCAAHRPISRSGEAIVCLPNGVSVKITGGGADFVI